MSHSTKNLTPLQIVMFDGYVMEEQDSGTHCNLPHESNLNFSAILKALKAVRLHGGATRSTAILPALIDREAA
jgi:hypothetical protein